VRFFGTGRPGGSRLVVSRVSVGAAALNRRGRMGKQSQFGKWRRLPWAPVACKTRVLLGLGRARFSASAIVGGVAHRRAPRTPRTRRSPRASRHRSRGESRSGRTRGRARRSSVPSAAFPDCRARKKKGDVRASVFSPLREERRIARAGERRIPETRARAPRGDIGRVASANSQPASPANVLECRSRRVFRKRRAALVFFRAPSVEPALRRQRHRARPG
jgi:hypothetical protein